MHLRHRPQAAVRIKVLVVLASDGVQGLFLHRPGVLSIVDTTSELLRFAVSVSTTRRFPSLQIKHHTDIRIARRKQSETGRARPTSRRVSNRGRGRVTRLVDGNHERWLKEAGDPPRASYHCSTRSREPAAYLFDLCSSVCLSPGGKDRRARVGNVQRPGRQLQFCRRASAFHTLWGVLARLCEEWLVFRHRESAGTL